MASQPTSASSSAAWVPKLAESKAERTRQLLYVLVMQGIGAALISGGINFGVSVAMYLRQSDITMWILAKNTIAGDMGVTVLIQVTVTFIITSSLIRGDLRSGLAIPLREPWPPAPASTSAAQGSAKLSPATRYEDVRHRSTFQMLKHNVETFYIVTEQNHIFQAGLSLKERFWRLFRTALQGFILSCCVFPWFWGIAIAILAPIYSSKNMGHTWIPMVIKGVYGALLGLVTNPLIALMNLGAHDVAGRITDPEAAQAIKQSEMRQSESAGDLERASGPASAAGDTSAVTASPVAPVHRNDIEDNDAEARPRQSYSSAVLSPSQSRMTLDRTSSNAHEDYQSATDVPVGPSDPEP
ncbi:hypothetical protein OC835_005978 [Tilletia horrida]|nr:hypothetical protein OC835_005978 [Tilletia horrida]KAK0563909.1 hypothetical protein OC844_001958 [Tilletia horrida]